MSTEVRRGQIADRCGTCKKFIGNGKTHNCYCYKTGNSVINVSAVRYANDYGKGVCLKYE